MFQQYATDFTSCSFPCWHSRRNTVMSLPGQLCSQTLCFLDLKSIHHPTHLSWHFLLAVWAAFTSVLWRYVSEPLSVLFHSALWPAEREWRGVWSLAGLEISVMETNLKMWDSADRDPAMVKTTSLKSWGQMNTSSSSTDEVSFKSMGQYFSTFWLLQNK